MLMSGLVASRKVGRQSSGDLLQRFGIEDSHRHCERAQRSLSIAARLTRNALLDTSHHATPKGRNGFRKEKRVGIMDRDPMFSKSFRACIQHEGGEPSRCPPRSPNLFAHLESFLRSLKSECVQKMVLFGKSHYAT